MKKVLTGLVCLTVGCAVWSLEPAGTEKTQTIYQPGRLSNSHWKTAGLYYTKFNGHVITGIGNATIVYGGKQKQYDMARDPEYRKEETPAGTRIKYKQVIRNKKTGTAAAEGEITILLTPSAITVTSSFTMQEEMEFNRYMLILLGTNISYLNTSKMIGYGVECISPDKKKNKTGMIPEKFTISPSWPLRGIYSQIRLSGEKDSIIYTAGQNALVHIGAAYNNALEIYSCLDPKNPDKRPIILKKGEKYEWTSTVQFENN